MVEYGKVQEKQENQERQGNTAMGRKVLKPVYDYLYSVRDAKRNVWNLQKRIQLHEDVCDLDEDCATTSCDADERHGKDDVLVGLEAELGAAEAEAAYRKRDVADMICRLPGINEQSILIHRYIDQMDWDVMALEMKMSKGTIKKIHAEALPRLREILVDAGEISEETKEG